MAGGKTFNLKAILSATDSISPVLKNVNSRIAGVSRSLKGLGSASASIASRLAMPATALSGLAGFSLSGIVEKFVSLGDSVDKAAKRAGVATGALQQLRYAARLGGMSSEQMDKSLEKLTETMGQAMSGKNAAAADMFRHLGISLRNADGSAKSAATVMRDLAEAVKANADPTARMRILSATFGGELAARLVPVLQDGAEGLDAAAAKARELGIVMDQTAVGKAAHLSDVLEDFRSVLAGVAASIGAAVAPAIEAIVGKIQKWVLANKDLIAMRLESIFNKIAAAIDSINIDALINRFFSLIDTVAEVIDSVGGVASVFKMFGALIAASLIGQIANLSTALLGVGRAFYAAFGPVGMIIAGVVAAGTLLYQNWDRIVAFVQEKFPGVVTFFTNMAGTIKAVWQGVGDAVSGAIDWIADKLSTLGKMLDPLKAVGRFLFGGDNSPGPGTSGAFRQPAPALAPAAMTGEALMPLESRMQGDVRLRIETPQGVRASVEGLDASGGTVTAETETYDLMGAD